MGKFCWVASQISETKQLEKCLKGVCMRIGNFRVPFWPIIKVALKFSLQVSEKLFQFQ